MLQEKSIEYGLQDGQTRPLSELERIFSIGEENISTEINRYFDSWQELSANPSGLVERDIVIQRGELLSEKFHLTINDLNKVKDNINDSIISKIDDINSKISEIAELNDRVFTIEVQGQTANGSRDRRDMLAKDLATSLGVKTYEDSKGMMAVMLPNGLPLVQGVMPMELEAVSSGSDLDIVLHAGGATRPLDVNSFGGEFEGLVHIRDEFIPSLKDDLDKLAYEITEAVNIEHAAGAGLDGVNSRNFFTTNPAPPPGKPAWHDAAQNMSVEISNSNHVAAAAFSPNVASGDNRNALIISNLGEKATIGSDTFGAYYGKLTAQVGIESNMNQLALGGAEDAMVQLQNLRDGLSGVSLEEEMINLIQFQRGFESSAKFLSTVDEMMASLMQLKR